MRILLSGVCGFVGSSVAHSLLDNDSTVELEEIAAHAELHPDWLKMSAAL